MSATHASKSDPTEALAETTKPTTAPSLTRTQLRNVVALVLAFACVVASLTIIVGTGGVVILSVGGTSSLAPLSLAVVFMGMSLVSVLLTHWIFAKWGRKIGFWTGCVLGLIGVGVGVWGLWESSPVIVLISQTILGAGVGIGMYVRYSGSEVVPPEYAAKATTWVLAGGCLAAFVGPEVSQATTGLFGNSDDEPHLFYLGTFLVTGGFFVLQAICVGMLEFEDIQTMKHSSGGSTSTPPEEQDLPSAVESEQIVDPEQEQAVDLEQVNIDPAQTISHMPLNSVSSQALSSSPAFPTLKSILSKSSFWLPLGIAILSWAMMAMPMSIFRITMREVGFTDRQSLTVIEFHFLSMYAPGFWTGSLIKKFGLSKVCQASLLLFILSISVMLSLQDNANTTAGWFIGFVLLGIAWNFGFSSATVWSTKTYAGDHAMIRQLKPKVQAANEALMFFLSGIFIFSTGYIYEDAGSGGISGWRLMNGLLFILVGLFAILLWMAGELE